jgi:Predicted amidohydrolase
LIKNVVPIPASSKGKLVDILVDANGVVENVAQDIRPPRDAAVRDAKGAFVSRGWLDLHTHIYYGATDISIRPCRAGFRTGVTTIVDAGSSGEANFLGFKEYIVERAHEDIFAFLNVGSIGLVACNKVPELTSIASVDVDRTIEVARANPDIIKGIKVRASHVITGSWGITPLLLGKKVARILNLPLMVHVGEPPPLIEEVLEALDPGDVVTHCFNGKNGGNIMEEPVAREAARRAYERGVLFDVGHGAASFSFGIARQALDSGLVPHIISTDLHGHDVDGPVWDLATTMSKLHSMGLGFLETVEAVTSRPASVIGLKQYSEEWLRQGVRANFTVFDLAKGSVSVKDSMGQELEIDKLFLPRFCVLGQACEDSKARTEALLSM